MKKRTEALLELIRLTSTSLPEDVTAALEDALKKEDNPTAASIFETILKNVKMAREGSSPICQDTGTPLFYVTHPAAESTRQLGDDIREAIREATRLTYLRPNAVDPISGKNSGDNIGRGLPNIEFAEGVDDELRVTLLLKGGGGENV